jgi:hypothetical protein
VNSGRCYCGAVRYALDGELGPLVNCHCRDCRRASGAAFATSALVRHSDLRVTAGEEHVRELASAGGARCFCARCGGRLWNRAASLPDFLVLLVATLDREPETAPILHVNVESKAPWYEILDAAPQHVSLPPGIGGD